MTKKLAKRWLNQNKWNIAKWNIGFLREGTTQFSRQYFTCKRAINSILFKKIYLIFKEIFKMECPICGVELDYEDYFGRIAAHQDGHIAGDIYRCPNGFDQNGTCDSESFSVAGSFYSYRIDDELNEGYPC